MDIVILSRIQFALTIMFHYLFPPLTIGLGVVLVYLQSRHYFTGREIYHTAAKFWTKIFALNFALGVASGIVMEFQFGTNWAAYSRFVGDVFGSALAAEGIFAFFLESGFLAVLVFGWNRVSRGMHLFATCMVSLGSIFSSVWIVVANSWQQTPAGHQIVPVLKDGQPWIYQGQPVLRAEITDFWQMVFNPSSVHRLSHVLIGCFIAGAFLVLSISSYYILKNRHREFAEYSFRGGLLFATVFSIIAAFSGHLQAKNVYLTQPAKMAALEAHYQSGVGDLVLFGIPNDTTQRVDYGISLSGGLSFLLFEDFTKEVVGLDRFRPEDRPSTLPVFLAYRVMVGSGFYFIGLTVLSCYFLWRKTLFNKRWLLWLYVPSIAVAMIANQAGWIAAEMGRQPWIVHPPVTWNEDGTLVTNDAGVVQYEEREGLRTVNGVSRAILAEQVLASIIGFGLIYSLLFAVWIFLLNLKIQHGPEEDETHDDSGGGGFFATSAERLSHVHSLTEEPGHT